MEEYEVHHTDAPGLAANSNSIRARLTQPGTVVLYLSHCCFIVPKDQPRRKWEIVVRKVPNFILGKNKLYSTKLSK